MVIMLTKIAMGGVVMGSEWVVMVTIGGKCGGGDAAVLCSSDVIAIDKTRLTDSSVICLKGFVIHLFRPLHF